MSDNGLRVIGYLVDSHQPWDDSKKDSSYNYQVVYCVIKRMLNS